MKKVTTKQRNWQRRQSFRKRKRQRLNSGKPSTQPLTWWSRSINAPRVFDLRDENNRSELLDFLDSILQNEQPAERLRINFQYTERVIADAMLLFIARLEQAINMKHRFATIKIAPPKNKNIRKQQRIRQVLCKVGAFSLCGQNINIPAKDKTVVYWRKLSGRANTPLDAKAILDFLEDGLNGKQSILFAAVKEALLNILHHAYEKNTGGGWWAFVHVKDEERTIVVCDLGMGIPGSINQASTEVQKQILSRTSRIASRFGREPLDSEMIRGSVKYGVSGTGRAHRGKGLPKMKQVVDSISTPGALLSIHSNKGCYTITSDQRKPEFQDYTNSIGGTVVTWRIPINTNNMVEI